MDVITFDQPIDGSIVYVVSYHFRTGTVSNVDTPLIYSEYHLRRQRPVLWSGWWTPSRSWDPLRSFDPVNPLFWSTSERRHDDHRSL